MEYLELGRGWKVSICLRGCREFGGGGKYFFSFATCNIEHHHLLDRSPNYEQRNYSQEIIATPFIKSCLKWVVWLSRNKILLFERSCQFGDCEWNSQQHEHTVKEWNVDNQLILNIISHLTFTDPTTVDAQETTPLVLAAALRSIGAIGLLQDVGPNGSALVAST